MYFFLIQLSRGMKIIGVGLPRTGTSSLYQALCLLGYKTVHNPTNFEDFINYDAFIDGTPCFGYSFLDCHFPNSKFIYTKRDPEQWFESLLSYFNLMMFDGGEENSLSQKTFFNNFFKKDITEKDKDYFIQRYNYHDYWLTNYFRGRNEDLLIMDITKDVNKWSALCDFLGKDIPDVEFPKTNSKNDRWQSLASIF